MLEHGGRLRRAAREYGIPLEDWLDLSTGISPFAWPVPDIPGEAWHRLPEDDDGLMEVARDYYGTQALLPVSGTQAAIQSLPLLRDHSRVGVLAPGYAEHAHVWRRVGHDVRPRSAADLLSSGDRYDVVILINPNNPGGETFGREQLLDLHASLRRRSGWLIVDEAFMDATPGESLCAMPPREGLIVLRSVGKFFGLAGARAGFVSATTDLLLALRSHLGPWALTGPTRHVLKLALADTAWHVEAQAKLRAASTHLAALLANRGLAPSAGTPFFQWCRHAHAPAIQRALARKGVLVRLFDEPSSLRFGLPGSQEAFDRLDRALREAVVAPNVLGPRR
ncbi:MULTISPECIES: threonine-phosphate decarboxylase CobD [Dyella]|uniref:threonine-phosphate decarboxylase n=2 Tax=Dyella TaxID=231454 RepID=A0A4R0YKE4_9GAMM|nr:MULTISPECIES: threonine-phosphate decarboxylase CobD [Dyella]TBR37043.1 threonine-phosphate decarboxylase [Dyella terrae]TCI07868.1 threonine-phosphate decarboxylase [Dyella soli]